MLGLKHLMSFCFRNGRFVSKMYFIWKQSIFLLAMNFQAYHLEFCAKPECDIKPSCFPQYNMVDWNHTFRNTVKLNFSE